MTETIGLQVVFDTSQFTNGLRIYVQGVDQATGKTKAAGEGASATGGILSTVLAGAFGGLAATAIPAAISAMTSFVSSGVDAVAQLQGLQIGLESLAAKELIQTGAASDMADAMGKVGPVADYLLAQLEEISLVSPFEYTDVVNAFRLNMAFGQTAETSLGLTEAILNMASASGLSGVYIDRIARNFGQMSARGKILQSDVNQLSEAGVSLSDMLRDQLGMSIDEVNDALEAGKMTMQDVSNAFIGYAEKNFGGAAERMSKTFSGIQSSFRDLAFFASQDVFGPVLGQVTDDLGNLYDTVKQFADSGGLKIIGEGLSGLYNAIKTLPGMAMQAGQALYDMLFAPLEGAAGDAFSWGSNMIGEFANGIIEGATNALIAAMDYISSLLSYWLAPGSPPLVVPDIDKWGAGAMDAYLEGFTDADFSILEGVQGPIQDVFSLLEKSGAIGDAGAMFAEFSQGFAAMLSTGQADESFFANLESAAGSFGDELAQLARDSLALASAQDAVTAAEQKAADAEKARGAALDKSASLTAEYNAMLKSGASKDALAAKLAEINAQEEIAKAAGDAQKQAEADLETSKAAATAIEEKISLQEQLISQLTDLANKTLPEVSDVESKIGGGVDTGGKAPGKMPSAPKGGGGGAGGGLAGGLAAGLSGGITEAMNKAKEQVGSGMEEIKKQILAKFEEISKPFSDQWSRLTTRFWQFVDELNARWDEFAKNFMEATEPATDFWNDVWPQISEIATQAIDSIKLAWNAMVEAIKPSLDELDKTLKSMGIDWDLVGVAATALSGIIAGVLVVAVVALTVALTGLMAILSGIASAFSGFFSEMVAGTNQLIDGWQKLFSGDAVVMMEGLKDIFVGTFRIMFGAAIKATVGFITGIGRFFAKLLGINDEKLKEVNKKIETWKDEFIDKFTKAFDGMIEAAKTALPKLIAAISEWLTKAVDAAKEKIKDFIAAGAEIITNLISGVTSNAQTMLTAITNLITSAITTASTAIVGFIASGKEIVTNMASGVTNALSTLTSALSSLVDSAISWTKTNVGGFIASGTEIVANIASGVKDAVTTLTNGITELFASTVSWLNDTKNNALSAFTTIGGKIIEKIKEGITDAKTAFADIGTAISDGIKNVFSDVSTAWGTFKTLGGRMLAGMKAGIEADIDAFKKWLSGIITELINTLLPGGTPDALQDLFMTANLIPDTSALQGISDAANMQLSLANNAAMATVGATAMPSRYTTMSTQVANNVNFGGVTINNGMDMAMFDARIRNILQSEYAR